MIKGYLSLNDNELIKVYNYTNKINNTNTSLSDFKKEFNAKIYNYGEGVLFYFYNNTVVASIKIVLEALKSLSTIYIHNISIDKSLNNKDAILYDLIEYSINIAKSKEANKILLGVRDLEILELIKQYGYITSYNAYIMHLKNTKTIFTPLELIELSLENKYEYLETFNDSFSDMPHGCYYDISDINNYLMDTSENRYYLVRYKNTSIGFMNIEINNNIGSFDIGLRKEFRHLGYGKRLLDTAIDSLNRANVSKVTLTVIEKNSIAFNMYKKRGFEIDSILSHWIEIK